MPNIEIKVNEGDQHAILNALKTLLDQGLIPDFEVLGVFLTAEEQAEAIENAMEGKPAPDGITAEIERFHRLKALATQELEKAERCTDLVGQPSMRLRYQQLITDLYFSITKQKNTLILDDATLQQVRDVFLALCQNFIDSPPEFQSKSNDGYQIQYKETGTNLGPRLIVLLIMRFGLNGEEPLTGIEVAKVLNISNTVVNLQTKQAFSHLFQQPEMRRLVNSIPKKE